MLLAVVQPSRGPPRMCGKLADLEIWLRKGLVRRGLRRILSLPTVADLGALWQTWRAELCAAGLAELCLGVTQTPGGAMVGAAVRFRQPWRSLAELPAQAPPRR